MRLLVIGRTGQLATELMRRLPAGVTATALGREAADLSDPAACAAAVARAEAEAVVNAAAWTAVDRAEAEEAAATVANGEAPAAMAQAAARRAIPFLHVSTDYVFPGDGRRPWRPGDATAPLGAYGRSKLKGEEGVRAAGGSHLILRTSWVFSAHGVNFLRTMLRLGRERASLRVVDDQVGGPTPAAALADALIVAARALAAGAAGGTHHFAGAPDVSWAGFAAEIMARAGLGCRIEPIASADYPTPARRPLNSRLDCTGFEAAFGLRRPDWRAGLDEVLREFGAA
jgi:dTDP-4-dehydrorhamnose reductase